MSLQQIFPEILSRKSAQNNPKIDRTLDFKQVLINISAIYFLVSMLSCWGIDTINDKQRNCLILLDQRRNNENIGILNGWFLTSRLQSAIAEKEIPILINAQLWSAFVEKRLYFAQGLLQQDTESHQIYNMYLTINERCEYWSHLYNELDNDAVQNKYLVVENINNEFYYGSQKITAGNYQLFLDYMTPFDHNDWDIYKNNSGFYLFIPKKYSAENSPLGFKIDSLHKVDYPEESPSLYFDFSSSSSIADVLSDFFVTYNDTAEMPYAWNILLAGHGGSDYEETNRNGTLEWSCQPIIADLTAEEFTLLLDFFHSKVKTHFFHYATCYGGGNHLPLLFNKGLHAFYHFPIMCDTLTDCASYCKWTTSLPSYGKPFLTTSDLIYDHEKSCWQLPLAPVYHWKSFFDDLAAIDFSPGAIENLQAMMSSITYPIIANIPMVCLPYSTNFFPLYSSDVVKIDEKLLANARERDKVRIKGAKTILLESGFIDVPILLDPVSQCRLISIEPGNALHYIKKLQATQYIDLPGVFWQAQYQHFDKTFIVDECTFPQPANSFYTCAAIIDGIEVKERGLKLTNVIISQIKSHYMRLFFTLNDVAVMVVAHKQSEEDENVSIQNVVVLNDAERKKYEERYSLLKEPFIIDF